MKERSLAERKELCIAERDYNGNLGCENLWPCSDCPASLRDVPSDNISDFTWEESAIRKED